MKKIILLIVIMVFAVTAGMAQDGPSAFDILEKIDENMVFTTARSDVDMIITIKGRVITKKMTSWSEGNSRSYIEFLSPARDKGTKMLRMDDIVKIYYPSAERIMRLSGHMLRQSMMGSDFSYEDMTERATKLREEYEGAVLPDEELDGRPCHVLTLTSKKPKQTYFTRKIWVDKERFIGLKEELFAKSGKLLKILTIADVKSFKNRTYPTRIIMTDQLRKNSKTEMVITAIDFDIKIPDGTFSERRLLKK